MLNPYKHTFLLGFLQFLYFLYLNRYFYILQNSILKIKNSRMSDSEEEQQNSGGPIGGPGSHLKKEKETPNEEWTLAGAGIRKDDYDVNLEHQRIGTIRGLEVLENVECLCLRNNMIQKLENVNSLITLTGLGTGRLHC